MTTTAGVKATKHVRFAKGINAIEKMHIRSCAMSAVDPIVVPLKIKAHQSFARAFSNDRGPDATQMSMVNHNLKFLEHSKLIRFIFDIHFVSQ